MLDVGDTDVAAISAALTKDDVTYRDLVERAVAVLCGNTMVLPYAPWAPMRGICPSPTTYRGVWNWDSAFHAIAVARWDLDLARDQLRILFASQLPSGQYVDVTYANGELVDTIGKPPVLAWAAARIDAMEHDAIFALEAYDSLSRNLQFWLESRGGALDGLCHYDSSALDSDRRQLEAKYESGWDDSPRWDATTADLWPADLNSYIVLTCSALIDLGERAGQHAEELAKWEGLRRRFSEGVQTRLWSEELGAFADVYRATGAPSPVLSPAIFVPLFAGIATQEQADRLAALARSEEHFFPGMPTVAYNDPSYTRDTFWRGPTWLNTAYFAIEGLRRYGHHSLADAFRDQILRWSSDEPRSVFEYYDSRSGIGLGAQNFGWSAAFILELVLGGAR